MKKLILLLLTLFVCLPVMAQHKRNHKPFRQFNNDTLSYVRTNVHSEYGGSHFNGELIGTMIDEIGLPVKSVLIEIIPFPNSIEVVEIDLFYSSSTYLLGNQHQQGWPGISIQIGMDDLRKTQELLNPIIKGQRRSFLVDWTPEVEALVRQVRISSSNGGKISLEALYKEY